MKVVIALDFDDDARETIIAYWRTYRGAVGLPKRATRRMIRDWVHEAIDSHWLNVADTLVDASRYEEG